jgi:hypothetical protein
MRATKQDELDAPAIERIEQRRLAQEHAENEYLRENPSYDEWDEEDELVRRSEFERENPDPESCDESDEAGPSKGDRVVNESAIDDGRQRLLDFIRRMSYPIRVREEIHREKTRLPPWVRSVSSAIGIATDDFLRAAGHVPGSKPEGWRCDRPGVFWKPVGCWASLRVRDCGGLWTVERERCHEEILTYSGGIICARTPEAAMRLAEFCYPFPDGLCVPELQWRETKV